MLKFLKNKKAVAVTEYAVLVSLIGVISIGAAYNLGVGVSEPIDKTNTAMISATTPPAPVVLSMDDLTPAEKTQLDTNGSILLASGDYYFVASTQREGPQSITLSNPERVTLSWEAPSNCPTGPFTNTSGSEVFSCDYDDPAVANTKIYVMVPGDGYLSLFEKIDWIVIDTCTRDSNVKADPHSFTCGGAA